MNNARARQQKLKAKVSGDGGGRTNAPPWAMRREQIKLTATPVTVRLYAGDYEDMPIYEYWATWIKRGDLRFVLCNCHGGSRDVPCALCYTCVTEKNDNYLAKPRVAINAVQLADFHRIEKTSERGTVWHELVKCDGSDALGRNLCKYCDANVPTVYGKRGYLNLGPGYWKSFKKIMAEVQQTCATCAGGLHVLRWKCSECGEILLDLDKTTASQEQRARMENEDILCPVCVHTGPADKDVGCFHHDPETDKYLEGCDNPPPATIFGVDLTFRIDGEGANSTLVCQDIKVVTPTEGDDPIKEISLPYDFESFLGSMSLEEQATALGLKELPAELLGGEKEPNKTVNYE